MYYIENTISEYSSQIKGYFDTLEEAKENLQYCRDWYSPHPGGSVYQINLGLKQKPKLIYKGWWKDWN